MDRNRRRDRHRDRTMDRNRRRDRHRDRAIDRRKRQTQRQSYRQKEQTDTQTEL